MRTKKQVDHFFKDHASADRRSHLAPTVTNLSTLASECTSIQIFLLISSVNSVRKCQPFFCTSSFESHHSDLLGKVKGFNQVYVNKVVKNLIYHHSALLLLGCLYLTIDLFPTLLAVGDILAQDFNDLLTLIYFSD